MGSIRSELESAGLVFPDFRRSNVEVAKEVAKGDGALIGNGRSKLFFLTIDALGYDLLEKAVAKSRLLKSVFGKGSLERISTVFPSFTPTVFTSIDSGLLPSEHGIIGSPLPIKEYGALRDIFGVSWWPAANEDSVVLFPQPKTVLQMAKHKGFFYLQDEKIVRKSEKADAMKSIRVLPYISQDDFVFQARKLAKTARLVYAYIWELDHVQHVYTKTAKQGFEVVTYLLERLAEKVIPYLKEEGWRIVITSDHGQLSTKRKDAIFLGPNSKIMQDLAMPPWGTESTMFFEVTESREKSFETRFGQHFGNRFLLYDSEEAIRSGLFGRSYVKPALRYRFGTYVAISKGGYTFRYVPPGSTIGKFGLGHHGGLTKEEMQIPLLIL
ncbi:MAG: alkaline phosphatase family protein [Candidatus Micrarchaeia archaeon]